MRNNTQQVQRKFLNEEGGKKRKIKTIMNLHSTLATLAG